MRADERRLRAEYVSVHEIQHLASAVIVGISGRSGKMVIAHLVPLKRFDDFPRVVIDDFVDLPKPPLRLTLGRF